MSERFPIGRHLSELVLDRYLYEDMPVAQKRDVEAHLESCATCRELVADVTAFDEAVVLAPPKAPATPKATLHIHDASRPPVVALSTRRRPPAAAWKGLAWGLAAAAAVALVVTLPSTPAPDLIGLNGGTRTKGSRFEVEFHVHDGERSRQVDSGDVVRPGERIGFRVAAPEDGYLLIVGIDETLEPYVCYPQSGDGRAARLSSHLAPIDLNEAMAFDDVLGKERIVALWCPIPVSLDDVHNALVSAVDATVAEESLPALVVGCRQRDIVLQKR